jgi:hypothetical protein
MEPKPDFRCPLVPIDQVVLRCLVYSMPSNTSSRDTVAKVVA